jgi:hypothetical protein
MQDTAPLCLAVCAAGRDTPLPEALAPAPETKSKGRTGAKEPAQKQAPAAASPIQATDAIPVMSVVDKSLLDAEAAAKAAARAFYSALDPKRALTRPDQIPFKQEDMVKRVMDELDMLKQHGKEHVAAASSHLRAQVCELGSLHGDRSIYCISCVSVTTCVSIAIALDLYLHLHLRNQILAINPARASEFREFKTSRSYG